GVGDAGVFEEGVDVGLGGVDIEFCDGAALEVGQLGYGLAALYDAVRVGGHDTARAVEAAHEAGHRVVAVPAQPYVVGVGVLPVQRSEEEDRKSTRLNSSHVKISYAVFCLKKKKKKI